MVTNIPATPDLSRSVNFEPVAWAAHDGDEFISATVEPKVAASWQRSSMEIVPLYRQPHPALTDEERDAIGYAISDLDHWTNGSHVIEIAETLRKLLERLGGER